MFCLLFLNTIMVLFYLAVFNQGSLVFGGINVGTLMLSLFAVLVAVQFVAMLFHRMGMALHVVASSVLFNRKYDENRKKLKKSRKCHRKNVDNAYDVEIVQTTPYPPAVVVYNGHKLSESSTVAVNGVPLNLHGYEEIDWAKYKLIDSNFEEIEADGLANVDNNYSKEFSDEIVTSTIINHAA